MKNTADATYSELLSTLIVVPSACGVVGLGFGVTCDVEWEVRLAAWGGWWAVAWGGWWAVAVCSALLQGSGVGYTRTRGSNLNHKTVKA